MRELASAAAKNFTLYSREPGFSEETETCYSQNCRWKPYSGSNETGAHAAVIIIMIILFTFLVSALCLGTAIRCFLRWGGSAAYHHTQQEMDQQKPGLDTAAYSLVVAPTLKYSAGLHLAGADRECTICLSKFEEGEDVKVLTRCNHGFHVRCIEQWLSSHFSCPVCRSHVLFPSIVTGQAADSQGAMVPPGNDIADAA